MSARILTLTVMMKLLLCIVVLRSNGDWRAKLHQKLTRYVLLYFDYRASVKYALKRSLFLQEICN